MEGSVDTSYPNATQAFQPGQRALQLFRLKVTLDRCHLKTCQTTVGLRQPYNLSDSKKQFEGELLSRCVRKLRMSPLEIRNQ